MTKLYLTRFNYLFILLIFNHIVSFSQKWELVNLKNIDSTGLKDIQPIKSMIYSLDHTKMKSILWSAPHEREMDVNFSTTVVDIGLADGSIHTFKIVEYDMMEEGLAIQFPDIKTFYGVSTTDPYRKIRIDYTLQGFRAVIRRADEGSTFIDHYQRNDLQHRVVYYRNDYARKSFWKCDFQNEGTLRNINNDQGLRTGTTKLRTYRLALACTGEYSLAISNPATTASSMSAMTTSMNRVNQVYEEEVAIRMVMVTNNNLLVYLNGSTDPYTNNDGGAMLGENQTNCNSVIGTANYDIGHVFSTGGGGVANLQSVCSTNNKARGVTGQSNPIGDPFDIDYVAHEIGHQFGGNHTFASTSGSCSGNGNNSTAFEPGSGTTIQAYAGICSPSNVQSNSDAYFHAISLQEMTNFAQTGGGNGCAVQIGVANQAPTITAQPSTYSIPKSTPFALTLAATDPENNPIIYRWEQMNGGTTVNTPSSTATGGPLFKAMIPTTNPTRFFPRLTSILDGTNGWTWEVLPSVARTLSMRGVARDDNSQHGCFNIQNVSVTTVAAAGPFKVTGLDVNGISWNGSENKTITWDVSGTTANGINCANVDILFTSNGGATFTTLLTSTPNDGTADIVVPNIATATGRVMVKGTGNVFLDINDKNIAVIANTATFNLTLSPTSQTKCIGQNGQTTISVVGIGGFTNSVTLSATNLPSGASASFSVNPVNPGNTSSITISNLNVTGVFVVNIVGVSGSINKTTPFTLTVESNAAPVLANPINMATSVSILPNLSWNTTANATSYDLQLAYDNTFLDIAQSFASVSNNSVTLTNPLYGGTSFYWRVKANNNCGNSQWSASRQFTTEMCFHYNSANIPLTISATGTPTILSTLPISDKGIVTDLNVRALSGTHSKVQDLEFRLTAPNSNSSLFWVRPCNKFDMDFNISFDDQSTSTHPCPPTNGLLSLPTNPLAPLNTAQNQGIWVLQVQDMADLQGGMLNTWGTKTCLSNFCRLTVDHTRASGPGSLVEAVNCAIDGDTIRFATNIINDTIILGTANIVINKKLVIESDIAKNIHIMSNAGNATFVNNTPSTNQTLSIKGLHIHSSNAGIGAILNHGVLSLHDVIMHKWTTNSTATIQNSTGASTTISGHTKIVQD